MGDSTERILREIKAELVTINSQLEKYTTERDYHQRRDTRVYEMVNYTLIGTSFILIAFGITQIETQLSAWIPQGILLVLFGIFLAFGIIFLLIPCKMGLENYMRGELIRRTRKQDKK